MQDNHFVETFKVQSYPSTLAYDIFIDETISSPEYYRNVINVLNRAAEGDVLNVYLNTVGGYVSSSSAITAAMDQCKGHIVVHMAAEVCSAGTMIALHGNEWVVGDGICFMCHNISFGCGGSAEKVKDHHDFIQAWNKSLLEREYSGFLTPEEITNMFTNGKEYWFNAEEVKSRLTSFVKYHETKHNQALEDSYTQQFAEEDAMVEEALAALQIPVAEREVFDKISSQLEDYFSQEQPTAKEIPVVSEETASMLQEVVETLTAAEDEQVIEITNGDNYFLLHYRYDEEDEVVELELQTEDDELIVISKYALEDYDKIFLHNLAKSIGAKHSHNSGKPRLIENIVTYLEGLVE
ncbi:head maturation protease [Pseudoalteromonas phage H101]|uniref:ATP-dependent Clp protease proteolytic subunit n=1 Tax=Pseudoalteromonas phage H101 TaxID=1654919 RepID=A0A0H4J275_9CAUD|nr:head maturation protease [Pseudoalteromonas phage H101]AKO61025.1 ATP-dependent Clp protease proteolytic subunit [Pseudoalteromonas phage H101]